MLQIWSNSICLITIVFLTATAIMHNYGAIVNYVDFGSNVNGHTFVNVIFPRVLGNLYSSSQTVE